MPTHIVAMGGGGFLMNGNFSAFDRYILGLSEKSRPMVCWLGTAGGDNTDGTARFYTAFSDVDCETSELSLFLRTATPIAEQLAATDVLYVGGGSTANLLNLWRLHGLDQALRERVSQGDFVMAGVSAGANCWFEGSSTDSFTPALGSLNDGMGFAKGSFCPHYDGEAKRKPTYRSAVAAGELPNGFAADDFAAVHLIDGEPRAFIAERDGAMIYRVERAADGYNETALETKLL